MKVLVLGGTGMLGAMVTEILSADTGFSVTATVRDASLLSRLAGRLPGVGWTTFDVDDWASAEAMLCSGGFDGVVNAVGITKPYINDDRAEQVERAIRVNALFPHRLAAAGSRYGFRVLQIATDCVYSGREGRYREESTHDALDVYGKTKSLGEVPAERIHSLRCSIVGPEARNGMFLLEWFLKQPPGAEVTGFTNHLWNGVTTLHFAKICSGIFRNGIDVPQLQHVVPSGAVTKAGMLDAFAAAYDRADVTVRRGEAKTVIDRTLDTSRPEVNAALWAAAGYAVPPTVPEMIAEMGKHPFRLKPL